MKSLREPFGCRVHYRSGRAAGRLTGLLVRLSGPDGRVALWLELAGVDLGRFIGRTDPKVLERDLEANLVRVELCPGHGQPVFSECFGADLEDGGEAFHRYGADGLFAGAVVADQGG